MGNTTPRNIVRFFDAESNADEQLVAYAMQPENAIQFAMKVAIANPDRGVQAMGWSDDAKAYTYEWFTAYPTKEVT